jgi:hypothetical protein
VADCHVAALELAHQLVVVVARDTQGTPRFDHIHHELHGIQDAQTAVDQITQENHLAPGGVGIGARVASL